MADDRTPEFVPTDDPPAPPVARSPAPSMLIDYRGDGSVPAHRMAPLAVRHGGAPVLVIQPGLNRITGEQWSVYAGHGAIEVLEAEDRLVADVSIPRKINVDVPPADLADRVDNPHPSLTDCLLQLIDRTWAVTGLEAIADAEAGWYGAKPRKVVMDALAKQRRRIAKRSKP